MKTLQRIVAVLVVAVIVGLAPASVLAQAPPYSVAFTVIKVTPASATVRATITGPNIPTSMTVAVLNYDEVLSGRTPQQATVQTVRDIKITDVAVSRVAEFTKDLTVVPSTLDDLLSDKTIDPAVRTELKKQSGKDTVANMKAVAGAKGLSVKAKAALDNAPLTKTVPIERATGKTVEKIQRQVGTEKHISNLQSIPLSASQRTIEFEVNTGKMPTWDGKVGSRAVLALIINGTYYYDLTHSSWWNASWLYRKAMSFNASTIATNLTSFPVRVVLSASNFDFAQAKSDGTDVRFLGSDDATPLSYEIAYWSQAGQSGILWVNVPTVTALGNYSQFIYMYYGNAAAADAQDTNATWGSYSTINTADATTNWTGTSLSVDGTNKKEGTGSVLDTNASPTATTTYTTDYNPPSPVDLSASGQLISLWYRVSRTHAAFTNTRVYIYDGSGNYRYYTVDFPLADTWFNFLRIVNDDENGGVSGTAPDMSNVTKISFSLTTTDTTAYTVNIDWLEARLGATAVYHLFGNANDSTRQAANLAVKPYGCCDAVGANVSALDTGNVTISAADATTNWTGTSLSVDNADFKEGTGSLVDTVAAPAASTEYQTRFTPASAINRGFRNDDLWIKSSEPSSNLTYVQVAAHFTNGTTTVATVPTLAADTWRRIIVGPDVGANIDGTMDWWELRVKTNGTPPGSYSVKIDGVQAYGTTAIAAAGGKTFNTANDALFSSAGASDYAARAKMTQIVWLYTGDVTNPHQQQTFEFPHDTRIGSGPHNYVYAGSNSSGECDATNKACMAYFNTSGTLKGVESSYVVPLSTTLGLVVSLDTTAATPAMKTYVNGALIDTVTTSTTATGGGAITQPAAGSSLNNYAATDLGLTGYPHPDAADTGMVFYEARLYKQILSDAWMVADNMNRQNTLLYYGATDATPTVTTGAATNVTWPAIGGTTATLGGNLTSLGADPSATVGFDYGITSAYGQSSATSVVSATGAYTQTITHFPPGVPIYYRAKATNSYGTVYGAGSSFVLSDNQRGLMPTLITIGMITVGLVIVGTAMRKTIQEHPIMSVMGIGVGILLTAVLVPAIYNIIGI